MQSQNMESFETQISRSFTSSPLPNELNPLTVRVTSSPIQTSEANFTTPIKKDSSFEPSSPENINNSNGLLTYSTPIVYSQAQINQAAFIQAYELFKRSSPFFYQSAYNRIRSEKRKPKHNFHSIDDLISSDIKSESESVFQNDSGYLTNSASRINNHLKVESSPYLQSEFNKNLQEAENEEPKETCSEEKENVEVAKQSNDNGKKFRTTFTDQQKKALDAYFQKNPYPDPKETEDLSKQLVLPENVIKVWFQNKRSRDKQRKFSNKSKAQNLQQNSENLYSSPIVANLQLLTSRLNSYAALVNQTNQNLYSQKYF